MEFVRHTVAVERVPERFDRRRTARLDKQSIHVLSGPHDVLTKHKNGVHCSGGMRRVCFCSKSATSGIHLAGFLGLPLVGSAQAQGRVSSR